MGEFLECFRPDEYVDSLYDIDLAVLKSRGYQALMLDMDNTLLPWASMQIPEPNKKWVETAKSLGMGVCIVSNTHNPRRLTKVANDLGISSVFKALKPRPAGFTQALKMLGCKPENTVVVGDQILTDIVGGNWACMYTILVKPIHPREFVGTKISRLIERWILGLLGDKTRSGTNVGWNKSEERDTK